MKSFTTGSATSASSNAMRTSRKASWILESVRRACPRKVLTTLASRLVRLSNILGAGYSIDERCCRLGQHFSPRMKDILLHLLVSLGYAALAIFLWRDALLPSSVPSKRLRVSTAHLALIAPLVLHAVLLVDA